jgi:ATP-dependent exoDNAse (exonuclease V) alpha subunit
MDSLSGPLGLTHKRATFSRREVIQGLCEELRPGARVDAASLEAHADAFLDSRRVISLIGARDAEDVGVRFRRRDGRLMGVIREEHRYSTPELLALEQRIVDPAIESRRRGVAVASRRAVEHVEATRPKLTEEQRTMVRRLSLDGDGVAVVVGNAGTGKTYALGAARDAWQAAGIPVLGVAVARRAAHELQDDSGIASTSVAALLADLGRWEGARLPDGCVLVVDEAGMVATRQLAALVDAVDQAGGKLVLVGDHRQLPELEAGGGFRGLVRRGLAIELTENRRQVNSWERRALEHLRQGDPEDALAAYHARDRLVFGARDEDVRDRLVADWWRAGDADGALMIAYRRADVAALNERAREVMRRDGALGPVELRLPGGGFAVGDHVVVKRNNARLCVSNGERGRVLGVEPESSRLEADFGGRLVVFDARFLHDRTQDGDPTLLHGYAVTGHVAQGVTVDRAYVLASEGPYREWIYTAMSRGREANHLYIGATELDARAEYAPVGEERTPLDRLAAALRTEAATSMAIDIGGPRPREDRVRGWARWLPCNRAPRPEDELADQAHRQAAERDHAARAEPPERASPPWHDAAHDRRAERRLVCDVDRDIGRSL